MKRHWRSSGKNPGGKAPDKTEAKPLTPRIRPFGPSGRRRYEADRTQRPGVFTKANKVQIKERFSQILEQAKTLCNEDGKKELDNLLATYRLSRSVRVSRPQNPQMQRRIWSKLISVIYCTKESSRRKQA